jgi:organic radical activating enzyme
MSKIIEIKQHTPDLYLTWVINNICTNKCSYCPPNLHNGTNHNYEWEQAEAFIQELLKRYPKIQLAISGGEPTLSPFLKDMVKMFSDAGHPVGMTTNGARTVRYFEEISQYMSYIVMSYHPSFEDPELLEKALACAKHTRTTVAVMMDSRHFNQSLAMYYKLCEHDILRVEPWRITPWIKDSTAGCDYTEAQLQILSSLPSKKAKNSAVPKNEGTMGATFYFDDGSEQTSNAQDLINEKLTNFYGWECDIGLNSLYVRLDGGVRLGNCISSSYIGNIQNYKDIQWPTKSFICPQTFCHCTTDVYVSKRPL